MRSVLLLTLGVFVAITGQAAAATVVAKELETETGEDGTPFTQVAITYSAAPGEVNRLTVSASGGQLVVRDEGAVIEPGKGCKAATGGGVGCATTEADGYTVEVLLGDGDDVATVTSSSSETEVSGGPGADRLTNPAGAVSGDDGDDVLAASKADGGAGNDVLDGGALRGGAGDDSLTSGDGDGGLLEGGPGNDTMAAGGGRDTVVAGPGRDHVDGGDGTDTVSYLDATTGVTVDLANATAGSAGEPDTILGIESIIGSHHADRLSGTDADQKIEGGSGADAIEGRGGNDDLIGNGGADVIDGGAGNDAIHSGTTLGDFRDDAPGRILCGPGRDYTYFSDDTPNDRVARDCETGTVNTDEFWRLVPQVRGRTIRVRVQCNDEDEACPVKVTIRSASGKILAQLRGKAARNGRSTTLATKVSEKAARAIEKDALRITLRGGYTGPKPGTGPRIRLQAAPAADRVRVRVRSAIVDRTTPAPASPTT